MLELKRKTLKFKLDEKEHVLSWPTVGQLNAFDKKFRDNQSLETVLEFMESLGGKRKVFEGMDSDHLFAVIEEFQKKRN